MAKSLVAMTVAGMSGRGVFWKVLAVAVMTQGLSTSAWAQTARVASSGPLEGPFRQLCSTIATDHPACEAPTSDDISLQWLLLADVCGHGEGESFCASFERIRDKMRPCYATYDQREDRWHAGIGRGVDAPHWAVTRLHDAEPRLLVGGRLSSCTIVVTGTNPLLHVAERGALDTAPAAFAANLGDFSAVLNDTAVALVPLVVRLSRLAQTDALAAATSALSGRLVALSDLRSDVVAAINAAEMADGSRVAPIEWPKDLLDIERWRAEFEKVRRLRRGAADTAASAGGAPASPSASVAGEETLVVASTEAVKLLDMAQHLLDREIDTAKVVSTLAAVRERWRQFVVGDRVLTWSTMRVVGGGVSWLADARNGFAIRPLASLGTDVVARHPKRDVSFRVGASAAAAFSVSTGLVLTWPKPLAFEARVGSDGVRRVAAVRRAGAASLLVSLDWRPAQSLAGRFGTWAVRPLLQAGVIVDRVRPGVAIGGGADFLRWLRVSAGATWQRGVRLDGLRINDPIATGESIVTREALGPSGYASVGISLGSLPLFRR